MESDEVLQALIAVYRAVARVADADGVGPTTMQKSKFSGDEERQSWIEAWGQPAYDALSA